MKAFCALILCFWFSYSNANVVDIKAKHYSDIQALYKKTITHPKDTLLVFDIDNTLLTMTQALGGVGWWDWQIALMKKNPSSKRLVATSLKGLVNRQNLLFTLIQMKPTEKDVLPFLKKSKADGVSLLSATARSEDFLNVTLAQLKENGFVDNQHSILFNGKSSARLECPKLSKKIMRYRGILFLNGEDKGQALLCYIKANKKKFKSIFFVDDSARNILAVQKAFASYPHLQMFTILYTHEHAKEEAFLRSDALQEKAHQKWQRIYNTIISKGY